MPFLMLGEALVVIALGPDGALARGALGYEVPGRAARVVPAIGPAGARATESWGAVA